MAAAAAEAAAPDTAGTAVSGSATKSKFKIAATAAGRKRQIEAANQTKKAKIAALKEEAAAAAAAAASAAAAITTAAASRPSCLDS